MMLSPGIKGTVRFTVDAATSAKTLRSGTLDVLATPMMIAWMEQAAWTGVAAALPEGSGTVGTRIDVKHLSPTPLGMTVTCEAELVQVDGRRLLFRVTASDEKERIGEGVHERFIIDENKFQMKANGK